MIIREKYLREIRPFYDSDLIKVITGIRRCGKSTILETIKNELARKEGNIIYLNFEMTSDLLKINNYQGLVEYCRSNKKEGKNYLFLDEIQELEKWEIAVKDLRLEGFSIFLTGSNSKLLSSEFATYLSGRYVSFRIKPFVYKEIKKYAKELNKEISVMDYLIWGGFPGMLIYNDDQARKNYLNDLNNTIVINDLVYRYNIKKKATFEKFVNYILVNNSRIYSLRSISRALNNEGEKISIQTSINYLSYLKEAFIINEIPQYSLKTKTELKYYGKIYDEDVSFNSLRVLNNRYDLDHNLENIVYNELVYRGYTLKVFDNPNGEIDFYATKNGISYLIQVSYTVIDEKTFEREMKTFNLLDNSIQKILITNDEIDYSTSTVKHIKLKDFLENNELIN